MLSDINSNADSFICCFNADEKEPAYLKVFFNTRGAGPDELEWM